jgi:TRAP-type C4-dicarboxylate transport system substrate-binding protein
MARKGNDPILKIATLEGLKMRYPEAVEGVFGAVIV